MKFVEDPRMQVSRKSLALAWIYFFIYLTAMMVLSYTLGVKPYLWGLPRWVAIGNVVIPIVFVVVLIFVVERFIPDIPLTNGGKETEVEE